MFALRSLVTDHVQILKFNRALLFNDKLGRSTYRTDPISYFIGITDSCRQTNQFDFSWQVNDHFFPNRSAKRVLNEVHFVKYHYRQIV